MNKIVVWAVVGFVIAVLVSGGLSFMMASVGARPGFAPVMVGGFLGIFVAYIGGNLAGNRKAPKASAAQRDAALSLTPASDQALLIVYREGFVGMAAGMNVILDGRSVAQLKSPRFTALSIPAGEHGLQLGFGGLAKAQNRDSEWRFTAAPGEVVAFRAVMAMGALKNAIQVVRVESASPAELDALRAKLSGVTMTAPDPA